MKRRTLAVAAGSVVAGLAWPSWARAGLDLQAPFKIGVAPHTSARVILEMYQPLRLQLEKSMGRPVEVVTAPDFTEFVRRATAQQYDLVITTGHQARLLQTDARYLPLVTYKADFRAVVLVAANAPYYKPVDLAGTQVLGLSASSLVTLWGQQWLHRNTVPQTSVRYVSAADSLAQLLLKGEGSAAFTSWANFQALSDTVRGQLRVLDQSAPLTGRVYLLNRRHAQQQNKVEAALWSFADTPEARTYFQRYHLEGYRKLEPRELLSMEPYANEVRKTLKQAGAVGAF